VQHTVNVSGSLSAVTVTDTTGASASSSTGITTATPTQNSQIQLGVISTDASGTGLPVFYYDDVLVTGWPPVYSTSPVMLNVFAAAPPLIGPAGADFVSMIINTNLAGYPIFETSSEEVWTEGSPDYRYDAYNDGVSGYRLYDIAENVTDSVAGSSLQASGWPAGSLGRKIRFNLPLENRRNAAGQRQRFFRPYSRVINQ
jgi:hypothetical protein